MELNTKGRYAVKALADISKYAGAETVSLSVVAERQKLSLDYLEQIFLKLRRAGIVDSARGRLGGYRLVKPASDIMVGEIMAAVDEETRMTRCTEEGTPCMGEERCLTHGLWDALGAQITGFLWSVSLQEVLDGIPREKYARLPVVTAAEPARPRPQ